MTSYNEDLSPEVQVSLEFTSRMAHGAYVDRACCGFCAFWRSEVGSNNAEAGTCRKRPPKIAPEGVACWPRTGTGDWCASFGWSRRAWEQLHAEYRRSLGKRP